MLLKILFFTIVFDVFTFTEQNLKSQIISKVSKTDKEPFESCFETIGCLETTDEWFDEDLRPLNLKPLQRHTINTQFILFNKKNDSKSLVYDIMRTNKESVEITPFRKQEKVVFLIHDFTSNGYTGWVMHISTAILHQSNVNVISVDWEAGAEPPYLQAIANCRVVALETVLFIKMLTSDFNVKKENIHLIGHGVGAHVAGYIGEALGKVGKITGLDPTGPQFEGMPNRVKLDASDAAYVEVLHTDKFNKRSQGTMESMGHADFFINNAKMQPRCDQSRHFPTFTDLTRNSLKEGQILPACSHKRAFKYYIESIENKDCEYFGIACESYDDFLDGNCTSCKPINNKPTCVSFGLAEHPELGVNQSYFLNTNGETPFCRITYRISISLEHNKHAKHSQDGYFEVMMMGENNSVTLALPGDESDRTSTYESGSVYTVIMYAGPPKLKTLKEARVKWVHVPNVICFVYCPTSIFVDEINVTYLSHKGEGSVDNRLCPLQGQTEIPNGGYIEFTPCAKNTVQDKSMLMPTETSSGWAVGSVPTHMNQSESESSSGSAVGSVPTHMNQSESESSSGSAVESVTTHMNQSESESSSGSVVGSVPTHMNQSESESSSGSAVELVPTQMNQFESETTKNKCVTETNSTRH